MERLIPVVNKLQDVFNAIGTDTIDLPQIVVVGSQSSGKSSVLENVVGRDFLPRGSGIVTRRPLVLQLVHLPSDVNPDEATAPVEWGEFYHLPNQQFFDFTEIREEIERETDRLVGKNKGISHQPISLKIYSPNVLNLTLVDLPGMTRVPVGDQPTDIEKRIREMILHFIEPPNAIIVAVSAANTDLANSDAMKLARLVDPNGLRTIGCITKIDLMDKGTDAQDLLTGKVIPLKLGFIGVINRSQQDINNGKSIKDALVDEKKFFLSHAVYSKLAARCGTPVLASTLNKLLMTHIREAIPDLKMRISKMFNEATAELASFGDDSGSVGQGGLLLKILTQFSNDFRDSIDGKLTEISTQELYGGARINYIFNEIFGVCLLKMNPLDGLSHSDIRTVIRNATGPRTALFIPEASFELLVKRQLSRLEDPSLQCVDAVFDELQRIISQLESKELQRFQVLREKVVEVVNSLLSRCRGPARGMIQNLLAIELAFINTAHPDFAGSDGAFNTMVDGLVDKKVREKEIQRQSAIASMGQGGKPMGAHAQPPPSMNPASAHPARSPPAHSSDSTRIRPKLDHIPATIKAAAQPSDQEKFETELIEKLLISYFDIVRKNVVDMVPKAIMHFLVNASKNDIQSELVSNLYREELFSELLEESPAVATRRKAIFEMVGALQKAKDILDEVRDVGLR